MMKFYLFLHSNIISLNLLLIILSSSHGKLFLVLFQATIYIFSFKKMWKGLQNF